MSAEGMMIGKAALEEAFRLATATANDPSGAARQMGNIAQLIGKAIPNIAGAQRATRFLVPEDAISITNNVGTGSTVGSSRIRIPSNGVIVGMAGTVAEGHSLRSEIGVSLGFEGVNTLVTNGGSGVAYVSLALLSPSLADQVDYFPYVRRVTNDMRLTVQFKNLAPAPLVTATVRTPLFALFLIEDQPVT